MLPKTLRISRTHDKVDRKLRKGTTEVMLADITHLHDNWDNLNIPEKLRILGKLVQDAQMLKSWANSDKV